MIPIIDIFAGPGGLGEGFSSLRDESAQSVFKIKLSIEKEEHAHRTLQLRAFFRQFDQNNVPKAYYEVLRGERTIEDLFSAHPKQAAGAREEAIQETLGEESWSLVSTRIRAAIGADKDWVLIGGPPCQAYSLVGRSRNKNKKGYIPEKDEKHFLYREYLRIIANFWPAVFVMENVKGLLSSKPDPKDNPIFARILKDLKAPADSFDINLTAGRQRHRYSLYSLSPRRNTGEPEDSDFILRAEQHGVPQARHRVIIVGVRDDFDHRSPPTLPLSEPVSIDKVLKSLPKLRSGVTDSEDSGEQWLKVLSDAKSSRWFKRIKKIGPPRMAEIAKDAINSLRVPTVGRGAEFIPCTPRVSYRGDWFLDDQLRGVCNHASRAHIAEDLYRYFYAACFAAAIGTSPKLADFPSDLLPDHRNVAEAVTNQKMFLDRFRVQPWNRPATTVTSHISKDGHYYIHPDPKQVRSFTVREAARLQTFPDNYFFTGPRTAQYVQVGNAVPPLMALAIAKSISTLFLNRA